MKLYNNAQNAKNSSITEETLVLEIDVGSETHYVRAFDMVRGEDIKGKAGKTTLIPEMDRWDITG